MTSLAPLHLRLAALVRRRRLARLATVTGAAALVAIVSLWAWFVVDWWFEWGRGPRLLGMLLAAAAVLLAKRRLARALATRETETDVALRVERRQRLDNDLVAALQFEPASAAAWGSRQLELAIVDYVAHFSETLQVAPERPPRRTVAGGLLLVAAAFASTVCVATHPRHATAFVDRLLLGTSHYPRRTRIVSVAINGRDLSAESNARKCAVGQDVQFLVKCDGELPSSGRIVLTAPSGETTTIELAGGPVESRPAARVLRRGAPASGGRKPPGSAGAGGEEGNGAQATVAGPPVPGDGGPDDGGPSLAGAVASGGRKPPGSTVGADGEEGKRGGGEEGNGARAPSGGDGTRRVPASSTEFIPLSSKGDGTRRVPARSTEFIPLSSKGDGTRRVPATLGLYVAHLPRLVDSLQCEIHVGDAVTERAQLVAVPSPVLSLLLQPGPPDYAASDDSHSSVGLGSMQISVVEGSRVDLEVVCENKELDQAALQLGQRTFQLQPADGLRCRWKLSVTGTPLERVTETLRFAVRATDSDGLELPEPLSGMIGLSLDHPPRVTASAVTQNLLPTARPTIHYTARDDYGLAGLWMRRELLRPEEPSREELLEIPIEPSHAKLIQGTLTLELDSLRLVKGDQLRITFEASDFRGAGEGKRATSEPLVLRVTDARGVLAAMTEYGDDSTGNGSTGGRSTGSRPTVDFDRIIEQQLGAEGEP